jgi:methylmalonyl-CoA/ethylmalonyl-CoA epimerase
MKDWQVRHLGFIVRDIEATTAYYLATGLATLGPSMTMETPERGRLKVQFLKVGPIEYELFEPVSEGSLQARFLERHGEGVQHVAFTVSDIETEIAEMAARGVNMLFRSTAPNGNRIAYFDTGTVGDFMTELVQPMA